MKRFCVLSACLSLLVLLVACGQGVKQPELTAEVEPTDMTLESLLEKHRQALGGEEVLASVATMQKQGSITTPDFSDQPVTTSIVSGQSYLRQIEADDQNILLGLDGSVAWEAATQFGGDPEPRQLGEKDLPRYRRNADLDGPLVGAEESGHQLEILGQADDGLVVKLTDEVGAALHVTVNPDTFLITKVEELRAFDGPLGVIKGVATLTYRAYQDVDGLQVAFVEDYRVPEINFRQSIDWQTVETGVEFEDGFFAMP